jgi:RNA polymerase sigma factor (sigma-70 family)
MASPRDHAPLPDRASASPQEWAHRLRRGDPEAVRQVRERVGRILAYRPLGLPPQDRADLEQEVVTAVWQAVNRTGFDFTAGFWGFVEVVASRRSIDWLRAKREQEQLDESFRDTDRGPLQRILEAEQAGLVGRLLKALGPPCGDLLMMRLHEEMSYSDISTALGRSEGALRVQMYRCVRAARKIVNELRREAAAALGEKGRP